MSDPASLPPGFRFHPTDEELILHYLRNQAASLPCPVSIIAEVDIYKFDPWDLPARAAFGEQEWYFFSPRDRKYPNGVRPNRAAGSGYWKATGTDKPIHASRGGEERIGVKKALVFYKGRPPKGRKTNWIMHEYRLAEARTSNCYKPLKFTDTSMRLDDWVLCRIYKKHCQPQALPPPLVDQEQDEVDPGNYSGGGGYSQSNEQFEGALRLQKSFSVSDFLDGYNTTASAAPPHGLFDSVPDMNGSELGLLGLNQLLADTSYMSLVQQKLSDQVQDESAALLSAKRPRNNNPAAPESNYLDAATLHALKKPSLSEANIYAADQFSNVQFDSSVHCNIPSQRLLFNQQQILLNSHLGLH